MYACILQLEYYICYSLLMCPYISFPIAWQSSIQLCGDQSSPEKIQVHVYSANYCI